MWSSAAADGRAGLWIARRYLFARSHGYATLINWVSFVGLALGVMILTVVVSVMNGFDREITSRILSAVPHAVASDLTPDALDALRRVDGVRHVSRFFQGEAMLARHGGVDFVALAGLDEGGARHMTALLSPESLANLLNRPGGIVLGAPLADARGLAVGDQVLLVLVVPDAAGVRPRIERFELAGTFELGAEPDAAVAVVARDELVRRRLTGTGTDGWRLHLADPLAAPALAARILDAVGVAGEAEVRFWMDDYGALFRAVKIEKAIMFALLALIVAIAAFNIVSGQAMLVNDKRGDIAMLTTMGASRRLLVGVFFLQGFSVAFIGVATGLIVGVAVAVNADAAVAAIQVFLGASIIDGTWFAEVPSEVRPADLLTIVLLSLGLSVLAVLAPAFRAMRENPAVALHRA